MAKVVATLLGVAFDEFHLLTLDGWEDSKGVQRELGYIRGMVKYAPPDKH